MTNQFKWQPLTPDTKPPFEVEVLGLEVATAETTQGSKPDFVKLISVCESKEGTTFVVRNRKGEEVNIKVWTYVPEYENGENERNERNERDEV